MTCLHTMEHTSVTGGIDTEKLESIFLKVVQGEYAHALELCRELPHGPGYVWETQVGTAQEIDAALRERDPRLASKLAKELHIQTFRVHFREKITALGREMCLAAEDLAQTGHPKRAKRIAEHLPKKIRRTIEKEKRKDDKKHTKIPSTMPEPGLSLQERHSLLEESAYAKEILDGIDHALIQNSGSPRRNGLTLSERTTLCVIIRTGEEGQQPPSLRAIINVTGYKEGRVKKAVHHLQQYRLNHTGWQLQEKNDEIILSQISQSREGAVQ